MLKKVLGLISDTLFPRLCVYCHQKIPKGTKGFFCANCLKHFVVLDHPACCQYCGRPMLPQSHDLLTCKDCLDLSPKFHFGLSLFPYNEVVRKFIHCLKYNNGRYLQHNLDLIFQQCKTQLQTFNQSTFVPVPLHYLRYWQRGFNQSTWIANTLARHCHGQVHQILHRKHYTRSQTSLTREARKVNVKGVFFTKKRLNAAEQYVLVDDVLTTGATLNACAEALWQQGARKISIFTLAHG